MAFILLLILVFALSQFIDCTPLAVTIHSSWWQYITFNLCHVSLLHLILNCAAILVYWAVLRKLVNRYILFIVIAVSSVLSALLGSCETPTMGASAICYAMIGVYLVGVYNGHVCISRSAKIEFLSILFLSFIASWLFAPSINTPMHVYAFSAAFILSLTCERYMYGLRKK